jgi:hypothetical protein
VQDSKAEGRHRRKPGMARVLSPSDQQVRFAQVKESGLRSQWLRPDAKRLWFSVKLLPIAKICGQKPSAFGSRTSRIFLLLTHMDESSLHSDRSTSGGLATTRGTKGRSEWQKRDPQNGSLGSWTTWQNQALRTCRVGRA